MMILDNRGRQDLIVQGQMRKDTILNFLSDEQFTNRQILKVITGIQSDQGVSHFIKRLQVQEVLKEIKVPSQEYENKSYRIIGITMQGMTEAGYLDRRAFEPSRLKLSQLLHKFLCQKVHIFAIRQGHKYVSGRWLCDNWFGGKNMKRPDGLIIQSDGIKVAVEAERTIKSKYRYQQIIVQYLKLIKRGYINKVLYVMPDDKMRAAVEKVMKSIDSVFVMHEGEKHVYRLDQKVWQWFEYRSI